jgi:hypothetical protein
MIIDTKGELMKEINRVLFQTYKLEKILENLQEELDKRNESPFWADKVIPFSHAILSVLIPLAEEGILFDPQGVKVDELTPELFLEWSDFLSLKTLAFTLQKSNLVSKLQRTKLSESDCEKYKEIDLTILGDYLAKNNVNLENEQLDFPISSYNLHQGVSNVIKSLL